MFGLFKTSAEEKLRRTLKVMIKAKIDSTLEIRQNNLILGLVIYNAIGESKKAFEDNAGGLADKFGLSISTTLEIIKEVISKSLREKLDEGTYQDPYN